MRLTGDGASWAGVVGRADKSWRPGAPVVGQDQLTVPVDFKSGRDAVSLGLFDLANG